jgi:hypothetical protein
LYKGLPVLLVDDWAIVTPAFLRAAWDANFSKTARMRTRTRASGHRQDGELDGSSSSSSSSTHKNTGSIYALSHPAQLEYSLEKAYLPYWLYQLLEKAGARQRRITKPKNGDVCY